MLEIRRQAVLCQKRILYLSNQKFWEEDMENQTMVLESQSAKV